MNTAAELRDQADLLDAAADRAAPGQILPEPHTLRVIAQQLRDRADELPSVSISAELYRIARLMDNHRDMYEAAAILRAEALAHKTRETP